MHQLIVVLNLITAHIIVLNAERILAVFPTPSKSHQFVFRVLIDELVRRGHDVVVITTHPSYPSGHSPNGLVEIDVYNVSHEIWQDISTKIYVGDQTSVYDQTNFYLKAFTFIFEELVKSKEFNNLIRNKESHFDLLILESTYRIALGLTHVYKAPVIQFSSFGPMVGTYSLLGVPGHPFLYPTIIQQRVHNLNFWEKIRSLYCYAISEYLYKSYEDEENEVILQLFGQDVPPLSELYNRVDMFFQSVHPVWMNNPPVPPNVIYLGGLHQTAAKVLPKDLEEFLNSSKHGVIYVSFGTNVKPSQLPSDKVSMMTKVFSNLSYDVLWKLDKKMLIPKFKNVKVSTWFPQSDLLRHPKMKLFITQGGLQSTEEALTAAVPLIGIPIIGDQWYNTEQYPHHKIGLKLDWKSLSEDIFTTSIISVIENKSYKENIIRLRTTMYDHPQTPLERAVWWTEHVLRHGGAGHLRAPAANMHWTQYYEIKLVLILATCLLFLMLVLSVCGYCLFKCITGTLKNVNKSKKS